MEDSVCRNVAADCGRTINMDLSSSTEGSEASDDSGIWMSVLKCYICGDLFRKPRILPCGHTFCSDCLLSLRDEVAMEFKKKYKAAFRRGESGVMTCPHPECDYSLRIMNLRRWTMKNKAAAEAVGMLRRKIQDKRDSATQTNLQLGNKSLSLPRIMYTVSRQPQEETTKPTSNMEHMTNSLLRMDPISKSHLSLNTEVKSWRSLATLIGMNLVGEMFSLSY
ncbi:uncharacterized protein LOC143071531 isoform X1 [Mytilus galloprovincialis]|uniref:uncharacterized protein LOC143071531 isoform X1 n=1 Tax=Mytilus galloprovincialis TaxID=29158 RepID=UPI003F7C219C